MITSSHNPIDYRLTISKRIPTIKFHHPVDHQLKDAEVEFEDQKHFRHRCSLTQTSEAVLLLHTHSLLPVSLGPRELCPASHSVSTPQQREELEMWINESPSLIKLPPLLGSSLRTSNRANLISYRGESPTQKLIR